LTQSLGHPVVNKMSSWCRSATRFPHKSFENLLLYGDTAEISYHSVCEWGMIIEYFLE